MFESIDERMPDRSRMEKAFLEGDTSYDGLFYSGVRTTGIFCLPSCAAKKPKSENVEFFPTARRALLAGYRPCKRCRPLEFAGSIPEWIRELLDRVDEDPARRWTDADLLEEGFDPDRVRRWFKEHHGMTFHAYPRARSLGAALGRIRHGSGPLDAAFDHGYESLSGFNEAFRQLFGEPPGRAEKAAALHVIRVGTPLGPVLVGATAEELRLLEFVDRRMLETQIRRIRDRSGVGVIPGSNQVVEETDRQLAQYFAGERREFDLPLRFDGTEFQEAVWKALLRIPCGETWSYGDVAREIGRPAAVRAVGRAVGDNRIAIVVPCHRVIGSDGSLTGYGGGLERKRWLLEHERDG